MRRTKQTRTPAEMDWYVVPKKKKFEILRDIKQGYIINVPNSPEIEKINAFIEETENSA